MAVHSPIISAHGGVFVDHLPVPGDERLELLRSFQRNGRMPRKFDQPRLIFRSEAAISFVEHLERRRTARPTST